jgi:23S rRNA (cytidine1920-2'-O)/16S rRNA (cytidine1409-2'-O)-methyltransferase
MKVRLDKLLLDRKLASSRQRAQALILAGQVLVNEQKVDKPGTNVSSDAELRLRGVAPRYVSRGGVKLEKALEHWNIAVNGRTCLDVGASTGGFTDCLLQRGAARVIAVDTGYGQLDFRLRQDPRVRLLEKTNARYLDPAEIPETIGLMVMDVSFISATLVLPAAVRAGFKEEAGEAVLLVKPQFEVGREQVGKGGIVRDHALQSGAVERVRDAMLALGFAQVESIESPILGAEGNREFLLHGFLRERAR